MITLKVFSDEQHKRGLLQIIQDVRCAANGSGDRYTELKQDIEALKACFDGWEKNTSAYDCAVQSLLCAVLMEVHDQRLEL